MSSSCDRNLFYAIDVGSCCYYCLIVQEAEIQMNEHSNIVSNIHVYICISHILLNTIEIFTLLLARKVQVK